MIKKILERAKVQRDRYVNFPRIKDYELLLIESSYVTGATEQREIDIQRACKWLDEYFDRCFGVSAWKFCESAKDEITKAMKGE